MNFITKELYSHRLQSGQKVQKIHHLQLKRFQFNPLKTKLRLLYLKTQSIPRCKHFSSGYKNQSVYGVSGISRCLFSDKYKTHKYNVGTAYNF